MKEFNLEAALNGEPVMLRNGEKAYIFKNIQDTHILDFKVDYPLIGMMHNHAPVQTWSLDGRISLVSDYSNGDIIGMLEEPKKQISIEDLPKPFKPKTGDEYKHIVGVEVFRRISVGDSFDKSLSMGGQCYRTEEDAQKWLDFMKSMME
nr:MAG TPA: hypothetical protein [Caudoviricetes sp.]